MISVTKSPLIRGLTQALFFQGFIKDPYSWFIFWLGALVLIFNLGIFEITAHIFLDGLGGGRIAAYIGFLIFLKFLHILF